VLGRYVGRQLTRVGALCQRSGLLAAAAVSFRTATWLYADPSWYLRLGRILEARNRWTGAEAAYARSIDAAAGQERPATAYYRQARARARRGDWDGAEAAFAAAVELRPGIAGWHTERAAANEQRADWTTAAASYRQAIGLQPEQPAWRAAMIRAYVEAGRPDQVIEAGTERLPAPRELIAAYEAVGDWPAAASLLRELVDDSPEDEALRLRLVDCLEQQYLVPFALDRHGLVTGGTGADQALAEAVAHLRRLVSQAPHRPGPPYRLGMLYERSGQLAPAADAYRLAMERMTNVDSWWCHRAAHEWAFRHGYALLRLGRQEPTELGMDRVVTPAGTLDGKPAGFFDAVVFRHGLQLSGFLLPGSPEMVEIHLDEQLLKQVRVDATGWRPRLRYDLTHGLLGDLPERSHLTVRAGGRPLVTVEGAEALGIRVPGGTGTAAGNLASGVSPTKKGSWPRAGAKLAERQEQYLQVYERAKELLEERGRQLFLCYGTLLGCHRERRFIPGDDDFDVSYSSYAGGPETFRKECWEVALELLQRGLDVNLSINGRLFKVGLDGVWIDITPMWYYQGRAWAFDAHDLTPEAIEPVQTTGFLDREVYVPRDPEAFLADTYGADWRTPQPQFRYYRSKADDRVLSQMWAKPSEVREFARLAEAERARDPAAGRFVGVGYPGYPGFSWLTSPDGPQPPN
jgi:tetratricopeptide (TPR) repeat protein